MVKKDEDVIKTTVALSNLAVEIAKIYRPTRLVLYGGAAKLGDNGAFYHASRNVIKDYKNDLPVKSYFISQGIKQFIDLINSQPLNSIQSLDIFGHGSEMGLYTVIGASMNKTLNNEEINSKNLASNLYRSLSTKANQWEVNGPSEWGNLYTVPDINFNIFTHESKIEIHGCNTANEGLVFDTLSAKLSQALFDAGKKKGIVIGHADYTNPNRGGTTDFSKQDYRHGLRIIYNNGKIIHKTRQEGRISPSVIKNALGS